MILSDPSENREALFQEISPSSVSRPNGEEDSATCQIWTEAGFFPPRIHRCIVELLHCSMMEEEISEVTVILLVSWYLEAAGYEGEYIVLDPSRLRRIAAQYGIPTGRRSDRAIARDVTRAVIGEYGVGA